MWRKTDLLFQKWQKFGEIWPEHSKVSKTCTFICSYCAKYLMFDLKMYRGVFFHGTKGDTKFEEKLTCGLENDMRNMANFHRSTWKSQNSDFDEILQSKVQKVWAPTGELCIIAMKNDTKFEEELTCYFKTDMRNLTNFDSSTWKSKKITH